MDRGLGDARQIGAVVGLAAGPGRRQGAVEILCFAVVAVWGRMFKYLQLDYNLGVLVIILMRMTKDIAMWITMSSIVLLAPRCSMFPTATCSVR